MKIREIIERPILIIILPTFLISAFIIFETFLAKGYMLWHAGSYSNFLDVIRVSHQELIWVAVFSILIILVYTLTHKISYKFFSGLWALLAIVASLALIIHTVLFLTTGVGLSRDYLQNYLKNTVEVNRMILAEVKPHYLALLIFQIWFIVWFSRFPESRVYRKLRDGILRKNNVLKVKKVVILILLIFVILLEAGALMPPLESVNQSINQFPLFELARSFLPEKKEIRPNIDIRPEERLDGNIELQAGPDFNRMNVVLIIFESLSWKYCDVYKSGLGATPFLAELAKKSLVMERLYTVDPHTTKALIPIIAGIYPYPEPDVMEARPGILPQRSLPHLLKRFSYRTAFFQTANNYEERPTVVANLGYDDFRGLYELPQEGFADVNYFGKEEMMMLRPSLEWVEADSSRPFFLTYLTLSTHHEYGVPPDFPQKDFGVKNKNQNRYLNAVRYTDYFIRRVFEEFEKRNLLKNTIFIIIGDHGEAFGEHGREGHNYAMWEEGLRVAGIIYAPGLFKKAWKISGFRSILDIAPTVCDLLGLEIKEGSFIGQSLLKPVEDDRKLYHFGWSKTRVMAARKGRYKYIFNMGDLLPELYDNLKDENDVNNLFSKNSNVSRDYENLKAEIKRLGDVITAQYQEWKVRAESNFNKTRPESFLNQLSADFGGLLFVYGYGIFPSGTEPGRTVWIRVGLRTEAKIKRPLSIKAVFQHADGIHSYTQNLPPRIALEKLNPGEYTTSDAIFPVPDDWPTGKVAVYLGVIDLKPGTYLSPQINQTINEEGLIYLTELIIHANQ